jgi:hypothetical protein
MDDLPCKTCIVFPICKQKAISFLGHPLQTEMGIRLTGEYIACCSILSSLPYYKYKYKLIDDIINTFNLRSKRWRK